MAKPIATFEVVSAAADAIAAAGMEPTLTLVQERTGGSYTTVKRHLEKWFESRREAAAAAQVPADVVTRGTAFVKELYAHAMQRAQSVVSEPLEHATAALETAQRQVAVAEAEVVRLEGVEQSQAAQIDSLERGLRELGMSLAAQQATNQEKLLAIARLESQLEQAQLRLAETATELATVRASSKAAEALEGRLETLQRSVQGLATSKSK